MESLSFLDLAGIIFAFSIFCLLFVFISSLIWYGIIKPKMEYIKISKEPISEPIIRAMEIVEDTDVEDMSYSDSFETVVKKGDYIITIRRKDYYNDGCIHISNKKVTVDDIYVTREYVSKNNLKLVYDFICYHTKRHCYYEKSIENKESVDLKNKFVKDTSFETNK